MLLKTIFFKLLLIIGLIEFLLMSLFYFIVTLPPFMEALADVFLLALLSTPFIYIFVLRPIEVVFIRQKKLEESMLHLSNQFIDNIDYEFDKKIQSVLSVTADAFESISCGAIYEVKDETYQQYFHYVKDNSESALFPLKIGQSDFSYMNEILLKKQSLFFCKNNVTDKKIIELFKSNQGCIIIIPMFSKAKLEGFICFETYSTQELHHDEILILIIAAQMIINAMKRHEIDQQLKKFSNALMQTGDAVSITDRKGIIEYVNPAFEALTKYSENELIGKKSSIMKSGMHEDIFYHEVWQTIVRGEPFHGEFINKDKSGILYYEDKTITSIKNDEGEITNYLSTGRDITQRKAMEHVLRELAAKDNLTKVFNRSQWDIFYNNFVDKKDMHCGFYLLLYDIDNFKKINDTFGHQQGDVVLKEIASRVQEAIRPEDILLRWGGEEFIIMTLFENDEKALSFSERIREVVSSCRFDEIGHVSVSIGIARHDEWMDKDTLVEKADQAMYQAKKEGKNRVKFL